MGNYLPRILLAFSALILVVGGVMHAGAFKKMLRAVDASNLPVFYANSLKGLWLIDAATLLMLAVIFAIIAAQPALASKSVVILLAILPAATAFFLYRFIGNFLPAHMLLAAAAAAFLAGLRL
jgi:hypothetical protein